MFVKIRFLWIFKLGVYILFIQPRGFVLAEVVISPSSAKVRENDSVTLTCTFKGTGNVTFYSWYIQKVTDTAPVTVGILTSSCANVLVNVNTSLYGYECPNDTYSTWTIKKVTRQNEGDKISCNIDTQQSGNENSGISVLTVEGFSRAQVVLSPSTAVVFENDSLSLTCTYSGDDTVISFTWSVSKRSSSTFSNMGIINSECNAFILPVNTSLYNYTCPTSKQYTWKIRKVTRQLDRDKYRCSVDTPIPGNINSEIVTLSVQVPVTSVSMIVPSTSSVTVNENTEVEFKCRTSGGLPAASVRWYKDSGTSGDSTDDLEITSGTASTSSTVNDLTVVTSTLRYSPSRNDNGWRIYCTASNVLDQTPLVSERKPSLNVRYPPGLPVITGYSDGGEYRVIENTQGRLSCSVTGGNPAPTLTWNCINSGTLETTSGGTVTKTHTWIAQQNQDKTCTCRSSHYSGERTVSIKIKVLYPPTPPTFRINSSPVSGTIKVIRNNPLSVSCISTGSPPPSYTWTGPNMAATNGQELRVSNVQNNGRYTCTVRNSMNPSVGAAVLGSNTSFIDVLVLYPPSIPTFNFLNTSGPCITTRSLDVIKGDTFKVACTSSGEPSPSYVWDNQGNNRILTVNSITTDRSSICRARNTIQETVGQTITRSATASLQIHVLYPPSVVTLKYHYGDSSVVSIKTTLSIREGNPFTVVCNSDSDPPSSYTWTGTVSSTSATLAVDSVVRSQTGTIICNVENPMTRTFANPEKTKVGRSSGSFNLQVLYPPMIVDLQNTSVAEGSPVTVSCRVTVGNPPQTTYQWLRNGKVWKSSHSFTIDTTSRIDAQFYTCKVFNSMVQTGEQQPTQQPQTKSFYLNVWYEPSITEFFVEGYKGQTMVTVDENDRGIRFTCEVDSNPASTVKILFDGKVKIERANTRHISFMRSSVTCLDAGEYKCEGNNQYGQSSKKSINLFVNCSPRPLYKMRQNFTSALHVPVTLDFTALAYPIPLFAWFKENGANWTPVLSNVDLHILSSALQSNLTILNVSMSDYGRYRLTVQNDLGEYVQYLYLEENLEAEGGLSETCAKCAKLESENTAVITGISLGLVVAVLAIYSTSITILYKRRTTSKDPRLVVRESTQKTYVNVAYKPNVPGSQSNDGATDAEGDDARQYTDLAGYSRDDRTTYEVLHDL